MSSSTRSWVLSLCMLCGCSGIVGERERDTAFDPSTDNDTDAGEGASGGEPGDQNGVATNGGTNGTTGGGSGSNGSNGSGSGSNGSNGTGSNGTSPTTGGDNTGGATGGSTGAGTGGTTGGGTGTAIGDNAGGSNGDPPVDPCGDGTEAFVAGLRIRQIALYQAVKIPLMTGGTWASTRTAPVVQGKEALVRVFVDTLAGYTSRSVQGVLTLDNAGVLTNLVKELRPAAASTDASLASTFNFDVAGADIGPDTKVSLALIDPSCPSTLGGVSDARFPATGTQPLGAERVGKLRVVVVPVIVSGLMPDTSATQINNMRDAMLAHYPVPDVEITVRAPLTANTNLSANGGGWSDVLNQVIRQRRTDAPAKDVYYYGVVAPASSFNNYCRGGCVLGLAPQTTFVSADQQAGLGVGFLADATPDTMVHELGHAHGRGHAPCAPGGGIQGVDRSFPHSGGGIGVWGWDSRNGTLQNPASVKDVMGYCSPTWISDYTYKALAVRSTSVNQASKLRTSDGVVWQGMLLYADGSSRWAGMTTDTRPGGDVETATVLDASGAAIAQVEVIRIKLSHVDDQLLYVPQAELNWASLVLSDQTINLSSVAAPLL